jgi:hypothetical protein
MCSNGTRFKHEDQRHPRKRVPLAFRPDWKSPEESLHRSVLGLAGGAAAFVLLKAGINAEPNDLSCVSMYAEHDLLRMTKIGSRGREIWIGKMGFFEPAAHYPNFVILRVYARHERQWLCGPPFPKPCYAASIHMLRGVLPLDT